MSLPSVPIRMCGISKKLKIWSLFLAPGKFLVTWLFKCGIPAWEDNFGLNGQACKSRLKFKVFKTVIQKTKCTGLISIKNWIISMQFWLDTLRFQFYWGSKLPLGSREKICNRNILSWMKTDESKTSLAGPAYIILFVYSEVWQYPCLWWNERKEERL